MKKTIILVLILFFGNIAHSTSQEPDILIIDGETHYLFSNPLESYFRQSGKVCPKFNEKEIIANDEVLIEVTKDSSNWRGYVATWSIEGNELFLLQIKDLSDQFFNLQTLFDISDDKKKIKATWYSGQTKIVSDNVLQDVQMEYGPVFEKEIIIYLESGVVKQIKLIDNTKKKIPSERELSLEELKKLKELNF